jgi:translation elongation factor P/translation initiation factor 5A
MKKRTTTKWLQKYDSCYHNGGEFRKEELEEILRNFEESKATYVQIDGGECSFYREEEETDEEYARRIKNEEEAKKLVEKVEFQRAKEIYLKLKDIFE